MATKEELVTLAASQIGIKEEPPNSNRVKYWDYYRNHCGVNYQGNPWCAAFVTYCMSSIGAWNFTSDEGRFRYCPSLVNWAKQNGQWKDREEVCQTGDIILFASGNTACHVGIVEKRISSSQVQTIEGNTSVTNNDNGGSVMRRIRNYGSVGSSWYILGFVRTPWSVTSNPAPSTPSNQSKSSLDVARDIVNGVGGWGNYPERKNKLEAAGYNWNEVQGYVNQIARGQNPTPSTPKPSTMVPSVSGFKQGSTYTLSADHLRVRTGPGTGYSIKSKSQLTNNAQQNCYDNGELKKGTRVTLQEVKVIDGNNAWAKIPSGWICIRNNGSNWIY